MFPLYDDNPTEIFPLVTLLIMGVCVGVWVLVQGGGFSEPALGGLGLHPGSHTRRDHGTSRGVGSFPGGSPLPAWGASPGPP